MQCSTFFESFVENKGKILTIPPCCFFLLLLLFCFLKKLGKKELSKNWQVLFSGVLKQIVNTDKISCIKHHKDAWQVINIVDKNDHLECLALFWKQIFFT